MAKRHSEDLLTAKLRNNPWILSTVVLVIFSLILIVALLQGNSSYDRTTIGPEEAVSIVTNIVELQTGEIVNIVEINLIGNEFYEVVVLYQNQTIPVYLTKDGKNLVDGIMPVELFIQQIQQLKEQQQMIQEQFEMQGQEESSLSSNSNNTGVY